MVVISDDKDVVSVAGIMGGLNSGCTEKTKNVFVLISPRNRITRETIGLKCEL